MKKRTIPILVASAFISSVAAAPIAIAGEPDHKYQGSMEHKAERGQAAVKDAWLDGKLETALLFNEHLNSFDIDTKVENGVAYLSGAVESDIDRDLAGQIAESIEGVTNVENNLVVDKDKAAMVENSQAANERSGFRQAVANATLTARIKSELLLNSNTAGLSIDVDSRGGEVTLSGKVDSAQEKELAETIAKNAKGAQLVENRLTVSSDS